jgi:metal-responsive CopG/Arc/MetJ family transcriptional regulator
MTTKSKQTFIRLNVDEKLDKLLNKYQARYSLIGRSDLIRVLLSEVDYLKSQSSKQQTASEFFGSLSEVSELLTEQESLEISNQLLGR